MQNIRPYLGPIDFHVSVFLAEFRALLYRAAAANTFWEVSFLVKLLSLVLSGLEAEFRPRIPLKAYVHV